MARLDELAEGIARLLKITTAPEPLPLTLAGEGPSEATVLVRALVGAARRQKAPLDRISIDPQLGRGLLREHGDEFEGVRLTADPRLESQLEIFRFPGE